MGTRRESNVGKYALIGGAVSTAFTVLGAAFVAKLYLALRAAKEAVPA